MARLAILVETIYPALVPVVMMIAMFQFGLRHERTLLLPFVTSTIVVMGAFHLAGLTRMFLLSLPSMMITLLLPLWIAALLSYAIREIFRRS
jgi:hypothetical protein